MLKVGIITFHRAINYGAVLQTYALSKYLRECGYDVQVLDYRCKAIEDSYKVKFALNAYSIKRLLLSPFFNSKNKRLFCNADCVFTNSFHGIMFSIIFDKTY